MMVSTEENTVFVPWISGTYITTGFMLGLAYLFVCAEIVCLYVFHFVAILYIKFYMYKKPNCVVHEELPGISILKPLVGVDANLEENLRTFFTLDYPKFELIFCVQDEQDPACELVQSLMTKFPDVDARLFTGGCRVGMNPKLNNLMPGYSAAQYDLIVINDSSIMVCSNTLTEMACKMTPDVGLVHAIPYCCNRSGFSATVEMVYFGASHCRMYICCNMAGAICVAGMSNMIRRSVINEAGGFAELGKYISEDFYMGLAAAKSGFNIRFSSLPAMQNSANSSLESFAKRMIRWTTVRTSSVPSILLLEPFSESILCGFCASLAVHYLLGWDPIVFFMVHILQWFLLDYIQTCALQVEPLPCSKFDYMVAWAYREICTLYFFIRGCVNNKVKWKSGTFRVRWGGYLEEIH